MARVGRLAPTMLAGLVIGLSALSLDNEKRRGVAVALAAGLLTVSLIALLGGAAKYAQFQLGIEVPFIETIFEWAYRPFSSVAALLFFPLLAVAINGMGGRLAIVAVVATGAAIILIGANASFLALLVGAPVFLLAWRWSVPVLRVMSVLLPITFVLVPTVAPMTWPSTVAVEGLSLSSLA